MLSVSLAILIAVLWCEPPGTTGDARAPGPAAETLLSRYVRAPIAGFDVRLREDVGAGDRLFAARVRAAMLFDLELIASRVPPAALASVRNITILVNPDGVTREGVNGRGACFHPDEGWLINHGFEGERAGMIEIWSARDYLLWRAEQPMMILHELAHAYHWRLGFSREDIEGAFKTARASGSYELVGHALAPAELPRRAYALTNAREYFAELSEAYFGRNDMAPFTREELRALDPGGFALVDRLWNLTGDEIDAERVRGEAKPTEVRGGQR